MSTEYIMLDKNREYVIYGAGSGGAKIAKKVLKENGKEVKAFLDKKAASIQAIDDVPVFTVEEYSKQCTNKDNVVIIVTLKNPFLHSDVASILHKEGFYGLVYQPLTVLNDCGKEEELQVAKIHNSFLMELRFPERQCLPKTKGVQTKIFKDCLLISREDSKVLCNIPIELLFNQTVRLAYADVSMPAMFPYVDFYESLLNKVTEEERVTAEQHFINYSCEYLKRQHMMLTAEKRKELVSTRRDIFEQMERSVDFDLTFFERTAPYVQAEKGIHFNLVSGGKNKISYQIAKGKKHLPVRMSETDYDRWVNQKALQRVKEYLTKNQNLKLFAPIPHPWLADLQSIVPNYSNMVLKTFGRIVMQQLYSVSMMEYQKMTVVDACALQEECNKYTFACCMRDEGTLYRYLKELGIKAYQCEPQTELETLLNELMYVENRDTDNGVMSFRTAVFDGRMDKKLAEELAERVEDTIYLFDWENGNVKSDMLLEMGFYIKKNMFCVVWDCKQVNVIELERKTRKEKTYFY